MSNQYMRQIIESIEKAQHFNEGYEDRVQKAVDALNKEFPEGVVKKGFEQTLDMINKKYELGLSELRPAKAGLNQKTGSARNDFIKDVAAEISFKRNASKTDAKRERINKVLINLAHLIDDAIGQAFPDGDPFDIIWPAAKKMGVPADDVLKWLDRAVREHNGSKDYHTYLRNVWRQHMETIYPDGDHPNKDAFG